MPPLLPELFNASLLEQACAKQDGNDKKRQEDKEQYLRNRSGTFRNSTKTKYGCNDRNNKKDN